MQRARRALPESPLEATLLRVRRRWQARSIARAIAVGGAMFALVLVLALSAFDISRGPALWSAAFAGAAAAVMFAIANRRLSLLDAAKTLESTNESLDNLVVTAAELNERPRPIRAEIRDEIDRQVSERLRQVDTSLVVPIAQPAAVAFLVVAGCVLLAGTGGDVLVSRAESARPNDQSRGSGPFTVRVVPPSYTRQKIEEFANPLQITAIAGSRIRIEGSAKQVVRDWIANESEGLQVSPDPLAPGQVKFLSVVVVPDAPPVLRVVAPGKDTAFATPAGQVAVNIESSDDLGLAAVSLRFTKASGGGENLAFTEGEARLAIERRSERH